jgi:hypothetical protein
MADDAPKIHVDTDWKAQAQAEKERLARLEQEKQAQRGDTGRDRGLPPADFRTLVGTLASQAIMGLGAMGDPKTGRVVVDLDGSKFAIDLLGVLEEKSRGNLTKDESTELTQVLLELRNRFVQITQLVAKQAAATGQPAGGGAGASPASGIITPG